MIYAFYKWAIERIDKKVLCDKKLLCKENIHDILSRRCYPTITCKECIACFGGDKDVAD